MKYKIAISDGKGNTCEKGYCDSAVTAHSITNHVLKGKDCHTFVQIDKIGDELHVNV